MTDTVQYYIIEGSIGEDELIPVSSLNLQVPPKIDKHRKTDSGLIYYGWYQFKKEGGETDSCQGSSLFTYKNGLKEIIDRKECDKQELNERTMKLKQQIEELQAQLLEAGEKE